MEEKNQKRETDQLPKFGGVNQHYRFGEDSSIQNKDINKFVNPMPSGIELVAQYYTQKYNAAITLPTNEFGPLDVVSFVGAINTYLGPIREKNEDCRVAFFLGAKSSHATPIIYIRENGKEGFLYADTKGVNAIIADDIQERTGICVHAVED